MPLNIRVCNPRSALSYVVVSEGGSPLYALEVGRLSGLVCLRTTDRYGAPYYHPINDVADKLPTVVQDAVLNLFDGPVLS